MTYLALSPAARFVRGPRRSALYDLTRKRIYPLDEWTTRLVAAALEGRSLEEVMVSLGVRAGRPRRLVREALSAHPLFHVSPRKPRAEPSAAAAVPRRLPMASAAPAPGRLEFLWLELTERCNLRCVHCYAGSGPGLSDGPMRAEDYDRVLREAAAAGCRRLQLNGGEATLHPDFHRLVDEAVALGFETIEVYTNATLLNAERIHFLKERGVRVAVSFYTHREEVHEAITRVPGSFRRTVQAIRALVQAGVAVRAGIIRMRHNQDDVEKAVDLLLSLGVAREAIGMDDVRPTGRGCGDSLVPAGGRTRMTAPPAGDHVREQADGRLGCSTCWSGKVAIAPSGEVFPCIFSRELPAGNVLASALQEVLQSGFLQDLWSIDKAQIPVCRDCEFRYGCFDCRALAYKQTGQLRSKPPSCAYDPYTGTWEGDAAPGAEASLPAESAVPVRGADLSWAAAGEIGLLYSRSRQALVAINRMAAEVWRLCDGRRSLGRIGRALARRYQAPESRVGRDVRALARDLAGLGFLEMRAA